MSDVMVPVTCGCEEVVYYLRPGQARECLFCGSPLLAEEKEVIHRYTRAQALADGVLVAVPEKLAKEAGVTVPAAMTAALWDVISPDEVARSWGESLSGRLWDALWMMRFPKEKTERERVYPCTFTRGGIACTYMLRVECGPGDDGEPVLTFMLNGED